LNGKKLSDLVDAISRHYNSAHQSSGWFGLIQEVLHLRQHSPLSDVERIVATLTFHLDQLQSKFVISENFGSDLDE
jgi:hypothetical protein